jgi:hypoxanthine phosphoribosyltransferase
MSICKLLQVDNGLCKCVICDPEGTNLIPCGTPRVCKGPNSNVIYTPPTSPTFFEKIINYSKAVTTHISSGMETRSQEEIERIYKICEACPHFVNNSCALCGCTISKNPNAFRNKVAMASEQCPIGKWQFPEIIQIQSVKFIYTKDLISHVEHAFKAIHDLPIDAVVGVSRSGVLPATYMSMLMHVPLFAAGKNSCVKLEGGGRMIGFDKEKYENVLVIDDSVISANSLNVAVESIKKTLNPTKIYTMGIYCHTSGLKKVNFPIVHLPLPHLFEWNIFNCVYNNKMATDLDGVLCPTPPIDLDKDDAAFREWIKTVKPNHFRIKREPVKLIITARPEAYKEETIEWLKKYDFRYEFIEFYPGHVNKRDENYLENVAEYKASILKKYLVKGVRFYIDDNQQLLDRIKMRFPAAHGMFFIKY